MGDRLDDWAARISAEGRDPAEGAATLMKLRNTFGEAHFDRVVSNTLSATASPVIESKPEVNVNGRVRVCPPYIPLPIILILPLYLGHATNFLVEARRVGALHQQDPSHPAQTGVQRGKAPGGNLRYQ